MEIGERDLAAVYGGAGTLSFARLAEEFARANGCSDCPYKQVNRPHEMRRDMYFKQLMDYSGGGSLDMRCPRRP